MKEIEKCPVCASEDIEQDYHQTTNRHVMVKIGSHCNQCGVKFIFNVRVRND